MYHYRIGYWWSEKKSQKMNVAELGRHFIDKGCEFIKIDLDSDLEAQGPFDAIIHKLSDVMCKVDCDQTAAQQVKSFEVNCHLTLSRPIPFKPVLQWHIVVVDHSNLNIPFQQYAKRHPHMVVVDSLDNVRKVLDRYRQYKIIENSELAIEGMTWAGLALSCQPY